MKLPYARLDHQYEFVLDNLFEVLKDLAQTKQVVTYADVGKLLTAKVNYDTYNNWSEDRWALKELLGHILFQCQRFDMPMITCLVVSKNTSLPGQGMLDHLSEGDVKALVKAEQEKCFAFWA